jgi:hypothetical protein
MAPKPEPAKLTTENLILKPQVSGYVGKMPGRYSLAISFFRAHKVANIKSEVNRSGTLKQSFFWHHELTVS